MTSIRERAGCSWQSERAHDDRQRYPNAAAQHDLHRDDLSQCDSWLCVCGRTDARGGTWETTDEQGRAAEPLAGWAGHVSCTECRRVYDPAGFVVSETQRD